MNDEKVIEWLMDSDPSIRWQVMRDLLGVEQAIYSLERKRVAAEGWGAQLLAHQDRSGRWEGQLYHSKWLSTTYSLLLLRQLGLEPGHPAAYTACKELLEGGFQPNGGISYSKNSGVIDLGVTGMVLSLLGYFGYPDARIHHIVNFLLRQQLTDGRWEPLPGNQQLRYTFDGTLLALQGLHAYEKRYPREIAGVIEAQQKGRDFLLRHDLYRRAPSEEAIDRKMLLFSFPPRWHYDLLAALDYFQDCRAPIDERLLDAITILKAKRNRNGSWNLQNRHAGKTYFEMEVVGKASKWNTLRALRVLKWWDAGL